MGPHPRKARWKEKQEPLGVREHPYLEEISRVWGGSDHKGITHQGHMRGLSDPLGKN